MSNQAFGRKMLLSLMPVLVLDWLRRFFRLRSRFVGNYSSWSEARRHCTGYEDTAILERVRVATHEVRAGRASYERDSIVFFDRAYNHRLIAYLQSLSGANGTVLRVMDVGGALGSLYWQHKSWLERLPGVHWSIVEQALFVECGKREFSTTELSFYADLGSCLYGPRVTLVILSSSLQYLPDPWGALCEIRDSRPVCIFIDRSPLLSGPTRIAVQEVPAAICKASYPIHLLSRAQIISLLDQDYTLVEEWACDEGGGSLPFGGMCFLANDYKSK